MTKRQDLPVFNEPTRIRAGDASFVLWGDETTGFVNDIIYAATKQLVLVAINLPPGRSFYHSPVNKPVYTGHVGLYVLQGQYTVQLPDTGEVKVAEQGEMILLRGPQWHFGCNFSDQDLWVLEAIAPPSAPGDLDNLICPAPELGFDASALKNFPVERPVSRLEVVNRRTALNVVVGKQRRTLLRVLASTEKVTVALFDMIGGQRTEAFKFANDSTLYIVKGRLYVRVEADGRWDELNPGDAYFFPAGTSWEVFNQGADGASAHLAVAGNFATSLKGV